MPSPLNNNVEDGSNACQITERTYARIGLMGNPSDGYGGKTISLTISNFWADVSISECSIIRLLPHPVFDHLEFNDFSSLKESVSKKGYSGGISLLQATCKVFYEYCSKRNVQLSSKKFSLSYNTNIPRQVGLAGSSAIIASTLKCLMRFFELNEGDIPLEIRPQLVLNVETRELSINAGLQDRVIQIYEGLVYMDFDKDTMSKLGHGTYIRLHPKCLPKFFVVYDNDPSDSSQIHSNVKERWNAGDSNVIAAMKTFGRLTDESRSALENGDFEKFGALMNQNFDLRRQIFGDKCIGPKSLEMIQICREELALPCKFPGSGGAIIGLILDKNKIQIMKDAFASKGYALELIEPYFPANELQNRH